MSSNYLRKTTRFAVLARAAVATPTGAKFRCCYCGAIVSASHATLDHVTPRQRGGSSKTSNLVVACSSCNGAKSTTSLAAFALRLATDQAWEAVARTAPIGATCTEVEAIAAELGRELAEEIIRRVRAEKIRKPLRGLGRQWACMYYTARAADRRSRAVA
jgi:hypothetical protein